MSGAVTLRLPANMAYRTLACRTASTVGKLAQGAARARDVRAALRFTHELVSAVVETFNNVVLHAYGKAGAGTVELELRWSADGVVVEIRDTGKSFDLEAVPTPNLDLPQERGMGVYIIRSCMDQVEYQAGPPNVFVLTKLSTSGNERRCRDGASNSS